MKGGELGADVVSDEEGGGGLAGGGYGLCLEVGEWGCGHVKVRNVGSRGGVGAVVCVVEVAGMVGATG